MINQKKIDKNRKVVYNLLNFAFNLKEDVVKINAHNTLEHEMAKFKIAYDLKKQGKTFITEAIFRDGGRADILVIDDLRIIEVLHSEKEKEALLKKNYYPKELDLFLYKTEDILKGEKNDKL